MLVWIAAFCWDRNQLTGVAVAASIRFLFANAFSMELAKNLSLSDACRRMAL